MIISGVNPWMAGVAALFTRSSSPRLATAHGGGIILPVGAHPTSDRTRFIVATFASVFPNGTMGWLATAICARGIARSLDDRLANTHGVEVPAPRKI
jgi:hypothetical protein